MAIAPLCGKSKLYIPHPPAPKEGAGGGKVLSGLPSPIFGRGLHSLTAFKKGLACLIGLGDEGQDVDTQ